MKNLLIGLILLFSFESFSQLNLDRFGYTSRGTRFQETIDDFVKIIADDNPTVKSYKVFDGYTFENGDEIKFALLKGEDGEFLDLIFFNKSPNMRWGILIYGKIKYPQNRKIVDFNTNFDDKYKFIFDNDTYITIDFNSVVYSNYGSNGEDKMYRYWIGTQDKDVYEGYITNQ